MIIGDGACGKTSLLSVFTLGYFPTVSVTVTVIVSSLFGSANMFAALRESSRECRAHLYCRMRRSDTPCRSPLSSKTMSPIAK